MNNFKEGDLIRMKKGCSSCIANEVYRLTVSPTNGGLVAKHPVNMYLCEGFCQCEDMWEYVIFDNKNRCYRTPDEILKEQDIHNQQNIKVDNIQLKKCNHSLARGLRRICLIKK